MARPLRLEFSGALYHVTARGDRREPIYTDEADREIWLTVLGEVCERFNWVVHGYCQMTNHYHLLLETPDGNLSKGMRQFNGVYTQRFNRLHALVGHLFQGRYKAILVQKEAYLLELSRYVVLNPVRAGMVRNVQDWPWSSYNATVGKMTDAPAWLDTDWLLAGFGQERRSATAAYTRFVHDGVNAESPWQQVQHQMYLGDEAFVAQFEETVAPETLRDVSLAQRRAVAKPLGVYRASYPERNEAVARAYLSGAYSMKEIGEFFGVHSVTVSRAVCQFEQRERAAAEYVADEL